MTLEPSKDRIYRRRRIKIKKRLKVGTGYMDFHKAYNSFSKAEKEVARLQDRGHAAMVFGGNTPYLEGHKFAVYVRRKKK